MTPAVSLWVRPRATTILAARGADARELLHRISTGDLEDLQTGEARATLFCDHRGRLLHRAVARGEADGVLLLRDDASAEDLAAWIDRHVFREDCRLEDLSGRLELWRAWEPEAAQAAAARASSGVTLLRPSSARWWALGAPEVLEESLGPARDPDDADERARIEGGCPAHGREIRDEFHPYEVGLAHEVHLAKGCYTGQEALQRMVTYRSARRRLARVRGAGSPPGPLPLTLWNGESAAGRLTSAAPAGPDDWIGLAVLPREWKEEATLLGRADSEPGWRFDWIPETSPLGRPSG